ncbi:MAG: rhamnose transport system permease protein [Gaiellales bacterium]|nr:rhamnose transport system permease protein [Gaiellales bacterium]
MSGIDAALAGNPRARAHRLAEIVVRFRELGIVLALLIVVAGTSIDNSRFLSETSLQQLLSGAAIVGLLAIGETLVIITRNVDLSIGSILGLSAYAVGAIYVHHPGVNLALVILAGAGIGLACGIVNGAIVTLCRVPSLVVTLGTLYVIRGLDASWAGGNQINSSSLPSSFNELGYGKIFGVPYLGIITIVCVIVATYGMRTFRSGRDLYAIGSNPEAARLAGIPVDLRVFATFAISGAIAGLAGVLWLAFFGSVDSTAGTGYEFEVVAAVVVGGVAIFGGSGSVLGAALGALLLNTIASSLVVINISSYWVQAIQGALLITAIAFDRLVSLRLAPALRTRRSTRE